MSLLLLLFLRAILLFLLFVFGPFFVRSIQQTGNYKNRLGSAFDWHCSLFLLLL